MWKDTRRSKTILNIFLFLLILMIIGGLAYVSLQLHKQTVEHDKELSEAYAQQQQQQAVARQETMTAVDAEYEKDLQTVAEYLPGIVCWGDNTTAAVSGMLNYPYVLQTYLNTYLCDIYDLSSSIENSTAPRLEQISCKYPCCQYGRRERIFLYDPGPCGRRPLCTLERTGAPG